LRPDLCNFAEISGTEDLANLTLVTLAMANLAQNDPDDASLIN